LEASLAEVPPQPPPVVPPPEPPAPLEKNPEFAVWAGFGKGSFVEFDVVTPSTHSITRTTVAATRSDRITLETLETVLLDGNRSETHVTSREVPAWGKADLTLDAVPLHSWYFALGTHGQPDGDEDIELDGRPYHSLRNIVSALPPTPSIRVWCCDEVPGRICRLVIADWSWRPVKVFSTVTLSRFLKVPPPPSPVVSPPRSAGPVEKNPEFAAWAGFGKGSFVEFEVVTPTARRSLRTTISAVRSESITLVTLETIPLKQDRSETHVTSRELRETEELSRAPDAPSLDRRLAASPWASAVGEERIEIGGTLLSCRRIVVDPDRLHPGQSSVVTMLWSDEVPGRLCWSEFKPVWRPGRGSHDGPDEEAVTVTLTRFLKKSPS
ncbi:MAG TPA: hypothetical protein VFF73_13895, partial [Planctomycetota bacterium]|nr:hypothetical protein [Planctomycetota bacterium]